MGAVVIDVEGGLPLEPGEAEALAGLAEDVSYGIQTLRARATQDRDREDLHRSRSRLIALSQAGRQLSRALDVDEVLRCLHGWVRNLMPCSGMIVSSYSPDDQLIRCVFAVMGDHAFDPAEMPPMPVSATGKGLQSSVILSGRPIVVNDYRARLRESSAACYLDETGRVDTNTEPYVDDDESPRSALMAPMILDGVVRGVIQIVTDVEDAYSDEHLELLQALAAPAAVAFSNAELYRRAQEEIVERKRAQEQRAQMEAHIQSTERLNAMGLVAGGVAHDFNNLLTGMVHSIELTRDHVPPGHGGRDHLEALAHDAERATALTRQLLAFSRKQVVSRRRIDISDAVGKTLEMVRRMIGPAVALTWTPCGEPAVVLVDPTQLDQVVMNLVVNASDALSGSGTIALSVYRASYDGTGEFHGARVPAGDYAVLECRDDGCGIDDQTYDRMFEPFYTTKALGRGTGLGLATVYGIVKQADGFINVESEVGSGSVFRIILPRLAGADAEPAAPERAAAPGTRQSGRGETVLVCDDERSILATVRRFLAAAGYTVLAASSPDEAVTLASGFSGTIDLLATDVMMPGATGPELAKSLVEARPGLRCLFMSGYTSDIIRELGAAGVGDDFLGKPFSRDDLLTKVREVLDR
ncbi:MAG: ATP-binding protein [Armatimonadetes bacterium]|nr:ATP-binding protein [Armatimonadota bacterium]